MSRHCDRLGAAAAEGLAPQQQLALRHLQELVEINTVTATGDTHRAAEAMAARLRAGGLCGRRRSCVSPAPRKGNLVARLRGSGARKPILLLAHIDVVPANREDWSIDPFKLIEQDGYFYGRGTGDDKYMAAVFVANLIRYKQEGYKPDRDIILALETDEEIFERDALGIQWLLKNHRDLIDAEFALNEGGGVGLKNGKPIRNSVQTSEKVVAELSARGEEPGRPQLGAGQGQCDLSAGRRTDAAVQVQLSASSSTRRRAPIFERIAQIEGEQIAADMRAVLSDKPDPAALSFMRLVRKSGLQCAIAHDLRGDDAGGRPCRSTRCRNWRAPRSIAGSCPANPSTRCKATLERVLADDQITVTQLGQPVLSAPSALNEEIIGAIEKLSRRVLARRRGASDDERRRDRRQLSAQCRHPDLRPFRACRRHRRRPRPRQGRARSGEIVLRGPGVSLRLVKQLAGGGCDVLVSRARCSA